MLAKHVCKLCAAFHVSYAEEKFSSGHIAWGLQQWSISWNCLASPQRISGVQPVISGFLVNSLTKAFLPQLLSLAGRPVLGRLLVDPNFFHVQLVLHQTQQSAGSQQRTHSYRALCAKLSGEELFFKSFAFFFLFWVCVVIMGWKIELF